VGSIAAASWTVFVDCAAVVVGRIPLSEGRVCRLLRFPKGMHESRAHIPWPDRTRLQGRLAGIGGRAAGTVCLGVVGSGARCDACGPAYLFAGGDGGDFAFVVATN